VQKHFVAKYLEETFINKQNIFNTDYVSQIKRSYYVAKKEYDYKIWYLLMFQMWYERWMNG
jgi:asparagine synthase (glutamine-hydrolysing)